MFVHHDQAVVMSLLVRERGSERGRQLLARIEEHARELGIVPRALPYSSYRNTIPLERQGPYPGDLAI